MIAIGRASVVDLVLAALRELLDAEATTPAETLGESTSLIGRAAVIDSLGLVNLIVDVEQRVHEQYGLAVTIADERAMSQSRSPFRSVAALSDYVLGLLKEHGGGG